MSSHTIGQACEGQAGVSRLGVPIQGFRIPKRGRVITGQSRDSMMALVVNAARIAVMVAAATSMSIFSAPLQSFFSAQGDGSLGAAISGLITQIDRNMAATQLTLAAIDGVQVPPGDTENAQTRAHASMLAGFGAASPPMAAGAMLLYQFTMALFARKALLARGWTGWTPEKDLQCKANVGANEALCKGTPDSMVCRICDEIPELSAYGDEGGAVMRFTHAGQRLTIDASGSISDWKVSGNDSRLSVTDWQTTK